MKMSWLERKQAKKKELRKLEKAAKKAQASAAPAKVGLDGKEMRVNPPADVTLRRLQARHVRVQWILANKFKKGHKRYDEFKRISNRLKKQIELRTGDY